ncbi:MAG: MerR family transcriptional regulator [Patescibacteria group bacterium]
MEEVQDLKNTYTISEAAQRLGVTTTTLRRWDESGRLVALRIGKLAHRRYPKQVIEDIYEGNDNSMLKPIAPITPVVSKLFNFSSIPPEQFLDLVQLLAKTEGEYFDITVFDGPYDRGRDIVCYEKGHRSKKNLVYIQVKSVETFTQSEIQTELDKIYQYTQDSKISSTPTKIIFATTANIIATLRDTSCLYARQLFPDATLLFWTPKELNVRVHTNKEAATFFINRIKEIASSFGFSLDSLLKEPTLGGDFNTPSLTSSVEVNDNKVDKLIKRSSELISERKYLLARQKIAGLRDNYSGEITSLQDAKLYNNLGLTYRDIPRDYDYTKAIECFENALDADTDFLRSRCNLAVTYFTRNEGNDTKKSWKIIEKVVSKNDSELFVREPLAFASYILIGEAVNGSEKTKEIIDEILKKEPKLLEDNSIKFYYSRLLTHLQKYEEALALLEPLENDLDTSYQKTIIALMKTIKEEKITDTSLIPNFKPGVDVRAYEKDLKELYLRAQEENRIELLPEIYSNWNICRLWIWEMEGEKVPVISPPLEDTSLVKNREIQSIQENLINKNPQSAFETLRELLSASNDVDPREVYLLSRMFLHRGYASYALNLLSEFLSVPDTDLAVDVLLHRSICEVLSGKKTLAIKSVEKALEVAKNTGNRKDMKDVYGHQGALLARYAHEKEGDRLLKSMIEFDGEFPELKVVTKMNVDVESEDGLDEIKNMMLRNREWFDGIRETYSKQPIPIYALEKTFKRPLVELWSTRGGNFPWEYNDPNIGLREQKMELLQNTPPIVFDYLALLTLSKAGLLGYLEQGFPKVRFYTHFSTFEKAQYELLQYEQQDLRTLWDFLSSSKVITFVSKEFIGDKKLHDLQDMLGYSTIQNLLLAKEYNALYITDDLRVQSFSSNFCESSNTFTLISKLEADNIIDDKFFYQIIRSLSDSIYQFIPFNADALHEIWWVDDYKLTKSSYHLINQMHLPSSDILSFMGVYVGAIKKLWESGALTEDKIFWLRYLSEETETYVKNKGKLVYEEIDTFNSLADRFGAMWAYAILGGRKDDILELKSKTEEILGTSLFSKMKDNVVKHIDLRLNTLKEQKNS